MTDPMVLPEGTKRFTPDDAHYHQPDERQRYLLGGGITGDYAVIPGSYGKTDGRSKGFDHNVPDVVCVDPDEKDGNIVVDLSKIDKATYQKVFSKHGSEDPVRVFSELSAIRKPEEKKAAPVEQRSNPVMPGKYVVPKADVEGNQMQVYMIPSNPTTAPVSAPPPIAPPTPIQQPDSNQIVIAQLMQQVAQLTALMQTTRVPEPIVTKPEPRIEEPVMAEETETGGFESLEIPFVTGPTPQKAKTQVFIELPGFGSMSTWFHGVFPGDGCVVLVYDTRYADGQQFCPPYNPETHPEGLPIKITIPAPKPNKTKEKDTMYETKYFGLKFALGVLDCVILVTVDKDDAPEYDNE